MWRKRPRAPRIDDEIRFHRDRLIDDYRRAGMSRADAERRAFLEFGNPASIAEEVRDVRGRWFDDFAKDLRYAVRTLRRNPAFSIVAALSLALGIGANSAIFSVVNAVMLQTLPVRAPNRLVQLARLTPDGNPGVVSYPLFEHFRDNMQSIAGVFAQRITEMPMTIDGEFEFVAVEFVSGTYFTVLGLDPAAGRLLGPSDDERSDATAAVISDGFWQRRFGRDASAIGRSFTLGGRAFTIAGVAPASYQGARVGNHPDLMLPLLSMLSEPQRRSADFNTLSLLARLKPGATVDDANAEVQVLFRSFLEGRAATIPEKDRAALLRQRAAAVASPDGFNPIGDTLSQPLLILMGIVGLILVLVCVNLSGLLLARTTARAREISIRLAIGAGRGRLVRQFLTETLVLASVGGAIGLVVSHWLSARLFTMFSDGRNFALSVSPDWRVMVFSGVVALVACAIAGLTPALQAVRVNLNPALKEVRARGHGRVGKTLVIAQLAISTVLIVAATLFVGSLVKLYAVERGFDGDGVLVLGLRSGQAIPAARGVAVQTALLERLKAVPGVQSASAAFALPVGGSLWDRRVQVEGYEFRAEEPDSVGFNVIAPGYFATLGTPLLSGRDFDDRDTANSPGVAIVNESFARHFFADGAAVGRHVTSVDITYEIVGVVRDMKYQSLRDPMLRSMYIPWTQRQGEQPSNYNYLVRVASGDPLRLVASLDRLVRESEPGLRLRRATTYPTVIDRSIATERIMAALAALFAVLALVVAGLGIFGVLAFQVTRRTNEIGVRLALGATRSAMTGLVLREVAVMILIGVAIGAAAAFAITGLARSMLFELRPNDPVAFAVAAAVLSLTAVFAGWLPARRAARVDPVVALRHE